MARAITAFLIVMLGVAWQAVPGGIGLPRASLAAIGAVLFLVTLVSSILIDSIYRSNRVLEHVAASFRKVLGTANTGQASEVTRILTYQIGLRNSQDWQTVVERHKREVDNGVGIPDMVHMQIGQTTGLPKPISEAHIAQFMEKIEVFAEGTNIIVIPLGDVGGAFGLGIQPMDIRDGPEWGFELRMPRYGVWRELRRTGRDNYAYQVAGQDVVGSLVIRFVLPYGIRSSDASVHIQGGYSHSSDTRIAKMPVGSRDAIVLGPLRVDKAGIVVDARIECMSIRNPFRRAYLSLLEVVHRLLGWE